jgi:sporulation protein YlmC with PRC-barrel domain
MSDTSNNIESNNFDWNQIVTKSVETNDGKDIGNVDGLEDTEFVVKDGIVHPKYYRIPRDEVQSYQDGRVRLKLSEHKVKAQFQRNNPGYYSELRTADEPRANMSAERTSNTVS